MPIDPSILFQAKDVEAPDIAAAFQQGQQIRNNARQGDLQDLQLKQAKTEQADKDLLGSLFSKHTVEKDGKKTLDNDAVLADLFSMGKPELATKFDADRVARETADANHKKALDEGDLKALELETNRTQALGALARGSMQLSNVPEPLRQQGWEMFRQKAKQIDPDAEQHIPVAYDPNWLNQAVEVGRTETESLQNRIEQAKLKADDDFRGVVKDYDAQVKAAGGDLGKLAQIQRDIDTKFPNSAAAKLYSSDVPKGSTGELTAFQAAMREDRKAQQGERQADKKEQYAQQYAQHYQDKTADQRDAATLLNETDSALERVGLVGGIYGDVNKVDIPGYGVGAKPFRKFLQSPEANDLKASISGLHNAYRHQLFGSALTATEAAAFEEFAGSGTVSNEQSLLSGLQKMNKVLQQRLRPLGGQRTKEILKDGEIMTYEDLPSPEKAKKKGKERADKDAAALDWAKKNPNDERAKKILQVNGL